MTRGRGERWWVSYLVGGKVRACLDLGVMGPEAEAGHLIVVLVSCNVGDRGGSQCDTRSVELEGMRPTKVLED